MKRAFVLSAAALALAASLAACGSSGSVNPSPTMTPAPTPVATPAVTPDIVARGNEALGDMGRAVEDTARGIGHAVTDPLRDHT